MHSDENTQMVALAKWRGVLGANFDQDFEAFWATEVKAKVRAAIASGDEAGLKKLVDAIPSVALERKPLLDGTRNLAARMRAAHDRFVRAGGSEAEWDVEKITIRSRLLQDAALAGSTDAKTTAWYQSKA